MKEHFYKDRYLIALYNANDELVLLVDNARELAEKLGKDLKNTYIRISHIVNASKYNCDYKTIMYNNQYCRLYLIDMLD